MYLCLPAHKKALVDGDASTDDAAEKITLSTDARGQGEQRTQQNVFLQPDSYALAHHPRTAFDPIAFEGLFLRRHEFVEAMAAFAAERRQLSLDLTDWHSFSGVLNSLSLIAYSLVVFIVILALYTTNLTATIVPLTSFIVSLSFVFGNTSDPALLAHAAPRRT